VQAALQEMVALKLVPDRHEEAKALFERYDLPGYPTLLFLDTQGVELDRIGDFQPPARLLESIARIRSGDTFSACLQRLDADPGNQAEMERAVAGFFTRYDPVSALERMDAFRAARPEGEPDPTLSLRFRALGMQHGFLYRRAARMFRNGWEELPDLSGSKATPALVAYVDADPTSWAREEQAQRLRQARHEDAGALLALLPAEGLGVRDRYDAARFAAENGHYQKAADLFRRWWTEVGAEADSGELNGAAWDLFLCRTAMELGVEMARAAYAKSKDPGVTDTLGQLLYVTGATNEAIEIERLAASNAESSAAEHYDEVVERMLAGQEMEERADFETYPD
jgi:hypothetical protein